MLKLLHNQKRIDRSIEGEKRSGDIVLINVLTAAKGAVCFSSLLPSPTEPPALSLSLLPCIDLHGAPIHNRWYQSAFVRIHWLLTRDSNTDVASAVNNKMQRETEERVFIVGSFQKKKNTNSDKNDAELCKC